VGFAALAALLLTSWKGRLQGGLLVAAVVANIIWSISIAYHGFGLQLDTRWILFAELVRNILWLLFLLKLLLQTLMSARTLVHTGALACLSILAVWQIVIFRPAAIDFVAVPTIINIVFVVLPVYGIVLIEQLYKNAEPDTRWRIKFLCIGLGGLMTFDLYMYSHSLVTESLSTSIWSSRGAVSLLAAPLIMVAAARNPNWSLNVFVSRTVVLHLFAFTASAAYLFAIGFIGYVIKVRSGFWGPALQTIFIFGAGLFLLLVIMSGQIRARTKVFLSKHFYSYKYDYRDEWVKLTKTLSAPDVESLPLRSIQCLAETVESRGGALFIKDSENLIPTEDWNIDQQIEPIPMHSPLTRFLLRKKWIVNLAEYRESPKNYDDVPIPDEITGLPDPWLVVPLIHSEILIGVVVLMQTRAPRTLNWEDYDLLKVVAHQVASDIAQFQAAEALAYAKQFETYNRVSAFIMHDLKNVTGQLSLVVQNGERLKSNPEFIEDAFKTVENAVTRMKRLLNQLKQSRDLNLSSRVQLNALVERIVSERSLAKPPPVLWSAESELQVVGNSDKLASVIGNVIQNAQDATAEDGKVRISMYSESTDVIVCVEDSGKGMTPEFVRNELFKPFVSTKGESGMGIGAYEAKDYVESLGGRISVKSEVGKGTSFTMRFPLVHTDTIERVA
jgi:putative PEP-CTERM system histidine kinase